MSGEKIFVNGPKIPPNVYVYNEETAFGNVIFIRIKQFEQEEVDGETLISQQ